MVSLSLRIETTEERRQALEARARAQGLTVDDYVARLLEEDLEEGVHLSEAQETALFEGDAAIDRGEGIAASAVLAKLTQR